MAGFGDLPCELRNLCFLHRRRFLFKERIARFEKLWRAPVFATTRAGFSGNLLHHHALVLNERERILHHFYVTTHIRDDGGSGWLPLLPHVHTHRYGFNAYCWGVAWYLAVYQHMPRFESGSVRDILGGLARYRHAYLHCGHYEGAPRLYHFGDGRVRTMRTASCFCSLPNLLSLM